MNTKIPFHRALLYILLSTLFFSGSSLVVWLYHLSSREKKFNDFQYNIVALLQRSSQTDALKSSYLAEILDISLDNPCNLYQYKIKDGETALKKNPLIKQVFIKKILPGTLFIDYQLRTPFAYIGDFSNTIVDEEGYLFPSHPFFTPKQLPIVYLGLNFEKDKWGTCVKQSAFPFAIEIKKKLDELQVKEIILKHIDLKDAYANYGKRQIILLLIARGKKDQKIFLRMNTDLFSENLQNFKILWEKKIDEIIKKDIIIVDLRIPKLAFISSTLKKNENK